MADYATATGTTGAGGGLWLVVTSTENWAGNYSSVHAELQLRGIGSSTHVDSPVACGIYLNGTWYSASFTWASGGGTRTIQSVDVDISHAADGSFGVDVAGRISATGTSGIGGFTQIPTGTFYAPTITVLPSVPTSVSGARVSDTQTTVSWAESDPSNGQRTSNTIRHSVNGGAWESILTISPATSTTATTAPNRKTIYGVLAGNAQGNSAWSASSAPIFTTPAAPSSVSAAKDISSNIVVSWANNVAFSEYQTVILHGTVTGGVTTWDGSPLATVASGVASYTHVSPSSSAQHVYEAYAVNTTTPFLYSAVVGSNTVVLLVAPNKPSFPSIAAYQDKAAAFVVPWIHNPVDTTAQTAYELQYSTNGGTTWSTTGKITSTVSSKTFAASTYAANIALTVRVRDWGQATSGGSDGTGVSPWSEQFTITFKTRPAVTVIAPANASTWTQSALAVALGFSQAESASFVQATIVLSAGGTVLETLASTSLASTSLATRAANGSSYTLTVTVLDSNGLTSNPAVSTFTVAYTLPVVAGLVVTYLPDSGIAQLDLTIPTPGVGEVAATSVTIIRTVNGVQETVANQYAITASTFTILDLTPSIYGTNTFAAQTHSIDGATAAVTEDLITAEETFAFVNAGDQYDSIIKFWCDPIQADPARSSVLVQAAGRARPVGLYGTIGSLVLSVAGDITPDSSTPEDIEALIQAAGKACYRDPFGRRLFGQISGAKISRTNEVVASLSFTITETS